MQFYGIREIYFNIDEVESDSEGKVEPLEDPNLDLAIAYRTPREELYDDRERFRNHIGFVRYQNNGGAIGSYNLFIPFHIVHNWGEVVIRVQVPIVGTFDDETNIRWLDVATGVEELEDGQLNTTNDGHIYDLGGRLVMSSGDYERHPEILRTGIYVRNGHKFVVK